MIAPMVTVFIGILLLSGGCFIVYSATRNSVPRWLKQWRGWSGQPHYDISDENAKAIFIIVGSIMGTFGFAALILGIALLFGAA
jgi:hypothetical protein